MTPTFRYTRAAAFALLAALAAPAPAQVTAPAAPAAASPAKKEMVKKAMQLQQAGIENMGNALAAQTAGQLLQLATPSIARLPQEKRKDVATELQAEVRKFQNEIAPILRASASKQAPATLGTLIEERLSEDELKVLVAWLESPVSRKYHDLSTEAQQALTRKIIEETRPQVEPKLKALEQAMTAKLKAAQGTTPAPAATPPAAPKK